MSEQIIGDDSRPASSGKTQPKISHIFRGHINHDKISRKEYHRTSKIAGKNQYSHMERRNYSSFYHCTEAGVSGQKRSHKKYKSDLYGLGRLDSHKGQLRSVTGLRKKEHCRKKQNSKPGIKPGKPAQEFQLSYDHRNDQGDPAGRGSDQKLPCSSINVKAA